MREWSPIISCVQPSIRLKAWHIHLHFLANPDKKSIPQMDLMNRIIRKYHKILTYIHMYRWSDTYLLSQVYVVWDVVRRWVEIMYLPHYAFHKTRVKYSNSSTVIPSKRYIVKDHCEHQVAQNYPAVIPDYTSLVLIYLRYSNPGIVVPSPVSST